MSDITIDLNGCRVNLRVGAIVTKGTDILFCRMSDQDWWFLPGGRIKTNESSSSALQRELVEEIGDGFKMIRPVVTAENFFDFDGRHFHEICMFYEVEWTAGEIRNQCEHNKEVFEWIHRDQIGGVVLKPDFIKEYIVNPRPEFVLVIHRDSEQVFAESAQPRTGKS